MEGRKVEPKVLIIGLDGATFDVLGPLIEAGKLPTLKRLKEHGVHGILESTFPPVTGPAWMSMATGKNPGKTGVFDFRNIKNSQSFVLQPISSEDFRNNGAIWDYLTRYGKRTVILAYPMLYPIYEINGVMVSGLGAPDAGQITYPVGLREELDRVAGGYEIGIPYNDPIYTNNEDLWLKDAYRVLNKRFKVIDHLLSKNEWDLFLVILSITDHLQHYMWKYWEIYCHIGKLNKYVAEFIKIFARIDEFIGYICDEKVPPDTHVFILSDHGFGSLERAFCINKWLENEGYLIRKKSPRYSVEQLRTKLKSLLSKHPRLYRRLSMQGLAKAMWRLGENFLDMIDLRRSVAFALDHSAVGQIYVNWSNRNPDAPIKDRKAYEEIRGELIRALKTFIQNNNHLDEIEIYRSDDIYQGDKLQLLPDIVFLVDNMACDIPPTRFEELILPNTNSNKSGNHRKEGILIGSGPLIEEHYTIKDAGVVDIAPTILHMLDIGVPQDVDGRVLQEIFVSDFQKTPLKGIPALSGFAGPTGEIGKEEEEEIRRRLEGLGYL